MRESFNACVDAVNHWGEFHWQLAAPMAVQVGLLVVALLVIDLVLRRQARAIVRYWLWALVLVKLMLPVTLGTPASVGYWVAAQPAASVEAATPSNVPPSTTAEPLAPEGAMAFEPHPPSEPLEVAAAPQGAAAARPAQPRAEASQPAAAPPIALHELNWRGALLLGWVAGVAILLALLARRTWTVRRIAREAKPAASELVALVSECGAVLRMNTDRVRLKLTDRLASPAICGFLRPVILLPRTLVERLDREQMRLVFVHELVHWKRFDLHVNWLQTLLQVVYFYNPAVWLACFMLRRLREQAVDEAVLVALGGELRRYGATLVDIAAFAPAPAQPMLRLIGVVESRTALAARIRRIVTRPIPRSSRLGAAAALGIAIVGVALLPMAGGRRPAATAAQPAANAGSAEARGPQVSGSSEGSSADATTENRDQASAVLSGRLIDETGAPVTEAKIELQRTNVDRIACETDEAGRYHFDKVPQAGEYKVSITSQRWVGITHFRKLPLVNLSNDAHVVRDFTLKRACELRIQVVDEQEQPVRSAGVYTKMESDDSGYVSGRNRTDKTGWVTLGGLEPSAATRIVGVTSDDYALGRLLVVLDEPGTTTHRIVVHPGQQVAGKALCSDGKPAAGWSVDARPTWWTFGVYPKGATIGADGSFVLPHVLPDKYNVSVSIPTSDRMSMVKPVLGGVNLPTPGKPLLLEVDHPSPGSEVAISGRIRYEGKTLERGFHATAYPKVGTFASYNCYIEPGQEKFEFTRVPRGVYRVVFESTEFGQVELPSVTAPAKDLEVTINVHGKLQMTGTVVQSGSGHPVPGFRVQITKQRTLSGPNYVQEKTWHEFQDAGGKFAIDVVGPGVYVATVEAKGLGTKQSEAVTIDVGSSPPLRIELGGGDKLTGTVVDAAGRGVDGAIVVPIAGPSWAHRITRARADEAGAVKTVRGAFAVSPLAAGEQTLKITHPDYAPAIVPLSDQDDDQTKPLKIVLHEGATLRGHVYDERGRPLAGATLHVQDGTNYSARDEEANRLATVATDGAGYYEIPHLPAVLLHVARGDKWRDQGVVEQMVLVDEDAAQTLDFGGPRRITGRLTANGQRLSGTSIMVSVGGPYGSVFKLNGRTDEDGVFALFGIPPGERTLYFSHNPTSNQWVRAADIEVTSDTGQLGGIDCTTGKLTVRCTPEAMVAEGKVNLSLREYDPAWTSGNSAGVLVARSSPSDPFVIDQVPLGKYVLVGFVPDHLVRQKIIEITADEPNPSVELAWPQGTASLSGKMAEAPGGLKLWSADGQSVGYLRPGSEGTYRLENLPAGEYHLKQFDTRDAPALATISLAEGEAKTLDVTAEMLANVPRPAFALVRTFTEGGLPLAGCTVRFDGTDGDVPRMRGSQYGRMGFEGPAGRYPATIAYPGFKPLHTTLELKRTPASIPLPADFEVTYRLQHED